MRPVLEQRDPQHAPAQGEGPARPVPARQRGRFPRDLHGQGRHLVRLRGPGAHPAREHQARRPRPTVPRSIQDLLDPKWKGKIGIAKPLFGTTATHAACLFAAWGDEKARAYFRDLKANGVQVLSGNKQVAQAVGSGQIAFGLTDTDDAMGEVAAGSPVAIVYPDREPGGLGTLFIPNTLAVIKGCAAPRGGRGAGRTTCSAPRSRPPWPTGPGADPADLKSTKAPARVETPRTVHAMDGRLRGRRRTLGQGRRLPRRRVRRLNRCPRTSIDGDARCEALRARDLALAAAR